MKFKALPIALLILLSNLLIAEAQRRNIYYLKNSGKQVDTKDSADFVRVLSEPDSGSKLYNVAEFYVKGEKAKLRGQSSTIDPVKLEGQCVSYFPSGIKREVANYKTGVLTGDVYDYYPNGKLYTYKVYSAKQDAQNGNLNGAYLVQNCKDSTGRDLVVEGSGPYIGYNDDFKYIEEQGPVKAGLRDSVWKGTSGEKNKVTFTETYAQGKLLTAQAVDTNGKIYTYTQRRTEPRYKGGMQNFYDFLAKNIEYPYDAKRDNIQGLVMVSFVVEKDGTLSGYNVLRDPNPQLSAEAVRVLKKTPKWVPGTYCGRLVRVLYTIPVNFSLSDR